MYMYMWMYLYGSCMVGKVLCQLFRSFATMVEYSRNHGGLLLSNNATANNIRTVIA